MSASVAGVRSPADGDDTDTVAALIANGTAKSDDPKPPHDSAAAQDAAPLSPGILMSVAGVRSEADDAASMYALGDAVMVVAGGGRRSHEGIVRFVGATRFAPRSWGRLVAL